MRKQSDDWTIVYYADSAGSSPVKEFLDALDRKTLARLAWSIDQLQTRNIHAREPLVKHIEGNLWELRQGSSSGTHRLLYFFFTSRKIVFLHGFQKKTEKTPRREIETALKRMKDFVDREGT